MGSRNRSRSLRTTRRLGTVVIAATLAGSVFASTPVQAAQAPQPAPQSTPTLQTPQPGPMPADPAMATNLPTIEDGFGATAAQDDAMTAAARQARSSGKAVVVPALTTETEQVTAKPTGGFALSDNPKPVRTKQHGSWVGVDTTLHATASGSLSPAATAYGTVAFSGGGTGPLVTTTSGAITYALTWPTALPAPHVSGDAAIYPDVLPGVDLQVSATVDGGFSDVLIVKTPAAAKNPALAALTVTTTITGGKVVSTGNGGLTVGAPSAANALDAATPYMWDSNTATPTGKQQPASGTSLNTVPDPSSASHPGMAARTVPVRMHTSRSSLALTPNRQLLTNPSTVFPVYIDPTFNWHPVTGGTPAFDEVKRGEPCTNTSFFDNSTSSADFGDLGVGYNQFNSCFGPMRAYYQFKLPTVIWGAHIGNAGSDPGAIVNVTKDFSQFCGISSTVTMRQTGGIGSRTTWNSQPGAVTTIGSTTLAPSFNGTCGTTEPARSAGFDVTTQIATAARQHASQFTVALVPSSAHEVGWTGQACR